ncbi:MAG: amidohydrolase family protein [Haliscomenobacter sp.]|nr:amidohydrolase family protein [Haliscomenobacter sp.]
MGFRDRGLLQPGYVADLVLFDPDTVTDHADMVQPTALSEGILQVWVNGQEVWRDGETMGNLPGKAVKR